MVFSLFSARLTKSQAACGFLDLAPTASSQPPDMLVAPGASPCCVGIAATPSVLLYSGHGLAPPVFQVPVCQDPSSAMATLPLGMRLVLSLVPHCGSSASCGLGARPSS